MVTILIFLFWAVRGINVVYWSPLKSLAVSHSGRLLQGISCEVPASGFLAHQEKKNLSFLSPSHNLSWPIKGSARIRNGSRANSFSSSYKLLYGSQSPARANEAVMIVIMIIMLVPFWRISRSHRFLDDPVWLATLASLLQFVLWFSSLRLLLLYLRLHYHPHLFDVSLNSFPPWANVTRKCWKGEVIEPLPITFYRASYAPVKPRSTVNGFSFIEIVV